MHDRLKIKFGRKGTMVLVGATDNKQERWATIPNKNVELMQFTGLLDKNGKEIYEGDIYHQGDPQITYIVEFRDAAFMGKQVGNTSYAGLFHWQGLHEVIGNIYENPELLTSNK